ncbi:hypothetical protein K2X89_13575, partial [Myxococcota bacterium]|nr:hypothetical protein [Myxococcota bacterium]
GRMLQRAVWGVFASLLLGVGSAAAAPCVDGTALAQDFPSEGEAVARWELCWEIRRMPDESGSEASSETLVLTQAEFRPGADAALVRIVGDLRMAEIFVPYHPGTPRFQDLTDFSFDLVALTSEECPGTRLAEDRVCVELRDRGLGWRDPFDGLARRGESLVIWSILNAGNYDYVMQYAFDDDGTIEVLAGATGQKLGGDDDTKGHFHNFAWRINLDLDGPDGDTLRVESAMVQGKRVRESEATVTQEGGIAWDPKLTPHLKVEDATRVNGRGRPLGYVLSARREGIAAFREAWTRYPYWVTRNDPAVPELRARNLPRYADRENVRRTDLVLWYMASHDHESNMRDEDRDTVPVKWVGFTLEPQNLWDGTPFHP